MIIGGRWLYKKYKKHQREKEETGKADHAKDEQLVDAGRDEVLKTPTSQLDVVRAHSDPPPSYFGLEDSKSLSPSLPAASLSPSSPHGRREEQASWTPSTPFRKDISSLPSPSPTVSPQHPPTDGVHGKWVWVDEDAPKPGFTNQKQQHELTHGQIAPGAVVELSADDSHAEVKRDEEIAFAELSGEPIRTA